MANEHWTPDPAFKDISKEQYDKSEECRLLILEGIANDIKRTIQVERKNIGCEYQDRIDVAIVTDDYDIQSAIYRNVDAIVENCLIIGFSPVPLDGVDPRECIAEKCTCAKGVAEHEKLPYQLYVKVHES